MTLLEAGAAERWAQAYHFLFYLSESILLLAGTSFSENGAIR